MKLVSKYQAGWVNSQGEFTALYYMEPFDDIWEAYDWKRNREDNPDGWIPGFLEYTVVEDLPGQILHT